MIQQNLWPPLKKSIRILTWLKVRNQWFEKTPGNLFKKEKQTLVWRNRTSEKIWFWLGSFRDDDHRNFTGRNSKNRQVLHKFLNDIKRTHQSTRDKTIKGSSWRDDYPYPKKLSHFLEVDVFTGYGDFPPASASGLIGNFFPETTDKLGNRLSLKQQEKRGGIVSIRWDHSIFASIDKLLEDKRITSSQHTRKFYQSYVNIIENV